MAQRVSATEIKKEEVCREGTGTFGSSCATSARWGNASQASGRWTLLALEVHIRTEQKEGRGIWKAHVQVVCVCWGLR